MARSLSLGGRVLPATLATAALRSGAGRFRTVEFDDQENGGPGARLSVNDLCADGVAAGRPSVLDVHAGVGSVEVHRG